MRKPDYNYRPNQSRAVYITAGFTEELAADVLPKILDLRSTSGPITVYINSRGGSILTLDTIHGALTGEDADENHPRIITVVLGQAASAAATLLVLGDYAIAHPHSVVHFHGARYSDIDTMTMEHASGYATQLSNLNRANAQKMANRSVGRVVRRYVQLLPEVKRENPNKTIGLREFVDHVQLRITSAADDVIQRTIDRIEVAQNLSEKVFKRARWKNANTQLKKDVAVFKALLEQQIRQNNYEGFRLNGFALSEIVSNYSLIRDYQIGEHYRSLTNIVLSQGPALLSTEETTEYNEFAKTNNRKAKFDWLFQRNGDLIRELWHYAVVLCRELQAGENRLTAADAYWLGCIDEVMGSKRMHGERVDNEVEVDPLPEQS